MADGQADFRLSSPLGDVEIELHPSVTDPGAQEDSERELSRLVRDFKYRQPEARRVLLAVAARLGRLPSSAFGGQAFDLDAGATAADAIGAELMYHARAGNLVVRRKERRSVVIPLEGGADSEPALGPSPTPTTWVSIKLYDADGNPVSGAPYEVTLESGEVRKGKLDGSGMAKLTDIEGDTCTVVFPPQPGAAA